MPSEETTNKFLEFNLPQDAYVAFDAVSLKEYIIDRLNENEKFTDQKFDGSNLAAVIDIIAYSYHVLLFYLNNTASEVNFDQATLYENMNKIVKLIGYKPAGKQTSIVPLAAEASAIAAAENDEAGRRLPAATGDAIAAIADAPQIAVPELIISPIFLSILKNLVRRSPNTTVAIIKKKTK